LPFRVTYERRNTSVRHNRLFKSAKDVINNIHVHVASPNEADNDQWHVGLGMPWLPSNGGSDALLQAAEATVMCCHSDSQKRSLPLSLAVNLTVFAGRLATAAAAWPIKARQYICRRRLETMTTNTKVQRYSWVDISVLISERTRSSLELWTISRTSTSLFHVTLMAVEGADGSDSGGGGRGRSSTARRRAFLLITVISALVRHSDARFFAVPHVDDNTGWTYGVSGYLDWQPAALVAVTPTRDGTPSTVTPWRQPVDAIYSRRRRRTKTDPYRHFNPGLSWKRRST